MGEQLGWAAAGLNILGFTTYFLAIREKCTTSCVGWFLSAVIAVSSAFSQLSVSTFANSAAYFFGALCCVVALRLSYAKSPAVTSADKLTGFVALVVALLSFSLPQISLYSISLYYLLLYSVFLRAIGNGAVEPILPWLIWSAGAILQLLSIQASGAGLHAFVLPATNLLCWTSVATMAYWCSIQRSPNQKTV